MSIFKYIRRKQLAHFPELGRTLHERALRKRLEHRHGVRLARRHVLDLG